MDRELDFYVKHGYCPDDAGLTIQWAFEDWSLGQMALKMKKQREAKYFQKRSMGWKASFHPELKLMIPRSEMVIGCIRTLCRKRVLFKLMHGRLLLVCRTIFRV